MKSTKNNFQITDFKRTSFFVISILIGMVSVVMLYPKIMLSIKNTFWLILFLVFTDYLVIKLKTNITRLQTVIGTCFAAILIQLGILLWLNFIPLDYHIEKHKIIGERYFDNGKLLKLKEGAYDDFFIIRYQNKDLRRNDTLTCYFKDGLLGFKVLDSVR